MKVRFTRRYIATDGSWHAGDERDVPEPFGNRLVERGLAEAVKPQRSTKKRGGQDAEAAVDEDREER